MVRVRRTSDMKASEGKGQIRIPGPLLIALHLVPGLIFAGFFFVLSRMFIQFGLTGYLALLIAIPLCLAPVEIGAMLLWSARFAGRRSLSEAIGYRQRGTAVEYIALPLLLFICWGVLSIAYNPISLYLETHLSGWLPPWATQESLINGLLSGPPTQRSITLGLAVLLSGFVAPVVEELYFRGFLLPRMEHWGWAAPVLNSLLFALYHFYFPGNVPGIFVAFVPLSYVVMIKKNWRIGAVVHSMFNLWGVFTLFTFLSKAA
jgi:membrane protease YdiL (CAAX protease family)